MIYGLSRDIEFQQVFCENWVNYERDRLALDQSQSKVRSSGRITREATYAEFSLGMECHFFIFRHLFFVLVT